MNVILHITKDYGYGLLIMDDLKALQQRKSLGFACLAGLSDFSFCKTYLPTGYSNKAYHPIRYCHLRKERSEIIIKSKPSQSLKADTK